MMWSICSCMSGFKILGYLDLHSLRVKFIRLVESDFNALKKD
jgi:hypothetical protein